MPWSAASLVTDARKRNGFRAVGRGVCARCGQFSSWLDLFYVRPGKASLQGKQRAGKQNHRPPYGALVLDDPALSLDDEHKARFVDRLVAPHLERRQVILATHYERFYEVAEPRFSAGVCLLLPPRRISCDGVSFEPASLLERVRQAVASGGCSWRDVATSMRRWAERTGDEPQELTYVDEDTFWSEF